MQKSKVIEHYGSQVAVAEALNISPAAVSKWPELIPELKAVHLDQITGGKLKYDPRMYQKTNAA